MIWTILLWGVGIGATLFVLWWLLIFVVTVIEGYAQYGLKGGYPARTWFPRNQFRDAVFKSPEDRFQRGHVHFHALAFSIMLARIVKAK